MLLGGLLPRPAGRGALGHLVLRSPGRLPAAPAQLLEALASLVIGLLVLALVLRAGLARSGPVAVAGLAAFTLIRQFILRLRAEPPGQWRYGRLATGLAAAAALIVSAVLLALAG